MLFQSSQVFVKLEPLHLLVYIISLIFEKPPLLSQKLNVTLASISSHLDLTEMYFVFLLDDHTLPLESLFIFPLSVLDLAPLLIFELNFVMMVVSFVLLLQFKPLEESDFLVLGLEMG